MPIRPGQRATRRHATILASALVHATLGAWLIFGPSLWGPPRTVHVRQPGASHGALLSLTYNPGGNTATHSTQPPHHAAPPAKPTRALHAPALVARADTPAPTSAGATGTGPVGEGDISIALMRYFPDPQPDLSTLPHGTDGNVIVSVIIDAQGHIAQSTLVQGLGASVDQSVLATIQTWTFTPATTANGTTIASKQELVFHYQRA